MNNRNNNDTNKYHFKNLVFEGGGVKGIAYVGALDILDQEGILKDIERVAGTSAGAMVAVLVGLGYSPKELGEVLWSIKFKNFLDSDWGVVRNTKRLLEDYGWYKGDFFRDLMAGYIEKKTGDGEITFAQLKTMRDSGKPFRDIHLIGADLTTGLSVVFNSEHTPNVKVADAARISMSIPLFFAAVKGVENDKHIYVDGGLLDNYAIKAFDRVNYVSDKKNIRWTEYYEKNNKKLIEIIEKKKGKETVNEFIYNKETLGFRLDSEEEIALYLDPSASAPTKEIKSFFTYTKALVTTLIDFQNNVHLHSDDWQRTVYIDSQGVNSIDFNLSDAKKISLVQAGANFTESYLEWYNNEEEKANK
ncbi:MAG: patatin-like phospholipase family protein [Bacteroidales bacterium]|nr:patatin-like phospholipase family protein [Bacteroidales bacterium]